MWDLFLSPIIDNMIVTEFKHKTYVYIFSKWYHLNAIF